MIDREKCCCTCEHCLRIEDSRGFVKRCECELDGHYIGYVETFERCCDKWERRKGTKMIKLKRSTWQRIGKEQK